MRRSIRRLVNGEYMSIMYKLESTNSIGAMFIKMTKLCNTYFYMKKALLCV